MKHVWDLALSAGRKRQSPDTGFVHVHCQKPRDRSEATPFFENLCFVLALFRTRKMDEIDEAKKLLIKLLHYQVEGNFPNYLHDYPQTRDHYLSVRALVPMYWIQKEFQAVLGADLRKMIKKAITGCLEYAKKMKEKFSDPILFLYYALVNDLRSLRKLEKTFLEKELDAKTWTEIFMALQILQEHEHPLWQKVCSLYNSTFGVYSFDCDQEGFEPATTLLDLYFAQGESFSARIQKDHFCHLYGSLVRPIKLNSKTESFAVERTQGVYCLRALWGKGESLVCQCAGGVEIRENDFFFTLSEGEEIAWYLPKCNCALFIENKKATTFLLEEHLRIEMAEMIIEMQFFLDDGEGYFSGICHPGNRPTQLLDSLYDAYDWKIVMRSIRGSNCRIRSCVRFFPVQGSTVDSNAHSMHAIVNVDN